MTCAACGGSIHLKESKGGVKSGSFTEEYVCLNCGATGTIRGEASESPECWTRTGGVFNT